MYLKIFFREFLDINSDHYCYYQIKIFYAFETAVCELKVDFALSQVKDLDFLGIN